MLLSAIAAMLVLTDGPALNTDLGYLSASQLETRCSATEPIGISYCYGFLAAVHDSVRAYESWLHVREFCLPEQTAQSDLRRAFLGYLDSHRADAGGQAASVVLAALKQRYPCPKAK